MGWSDEIQVHSNRQQTLWDNSYFFKSYIFCTYCLLTHQVLGRLQPEWCHLASHTWWRQSNPRPTSSQTGRSYPHKPSSACSSSHCTLIQLSPSFPTTPSWQGLCCPQTVCPPTSNSVEHTERWDRWMYTCLFTSVCVSHREPAVQNVNQILDWFSGHWQDEKCPHTSTVACSNNETIQDPGSKTPPEKDISQGQVCSATLVL